MPLLTVVDWMEVAPQVPPPEPRIFTQNGRTLECVREGEDWKVRRVISTDLRDFLDPRYQPGEHFTPGMGTTF